MYAQPRTSQTVLGHYWEWQFNIQLTAVRWWRGERSNALLARTQSKHCLELLWLKPSRSQSQVAEAVKSLPRHSSRSCSSSNHLLTVQLCIDVPLNPDCNRQTMEMRKRIKTTTPAQVIWMESTIKWEGLMPCLRPLLLSKYYYPIKTNIMRPKQSQPPFHRSAVEIKGNSSPIASVQHCLHLLKKNVNFKWGHGSQWRHF